MANYKNASKGELVAIYRLEFYKNKKKWKFYKNDRLKKDVPSKQKLNETYRVEEQPPEVEPPEPLNDAFLETDSDENLKEELRPEPPPPTLRRRRNTLLDMKPPPEERDWAVPHVKAEQGWEPSVEPVRSYEAEWEKEERWGDDMQCVEQVYASELVSGGGRRPPVLAGWPAPAQPTEPNMLHHLVQTIGAQRLGQRPNVDDVMRQQTDSVGPLGQHVGQPGQNVHAGQTFGQVGPILRQNTEILDHVDYSLKRNTNQSLGYIEPEILKQNLYQNCKIGQIIEQNLRHHMGQKVVDFGQMEWEPERDLCGLGRGVDSGVGGEVCGGDACVAGAVAALAEAEGWLTGSLQHFYLEPALGEAPCAPPAGCDVSLSSGDSAAFVRGAHARPHSSEVELASDSPCECASMSASKLAHMSSGALRDALRAHAAAALRVLNELRARADHNYKQPCALSNDVTQESLPTRDTQPHATAVRDIPAQAATPCDMPPHLATPCDMPPHLATPCDMPPHLATPCDMPPHLATPCDMPPHLATPCDMPPGRGRGRRLLTK